MAQPNFEMATSEIGTGNPPAPNKAHADVTGDTTPPRGIRRETPMMIGGKPSNVTPISPEMRARQNEQ